jgi:hypothetical protein
MSAKFAATLLNEYRVRTLIPCHTSWLPQETSYLNEELGGENISWEEDNGRRSYTANACNNSFEGSVFRTETIFCYQTKKHALD